MLEELIKILASMPPPQLSEGSRREFFSRVQYLAPHLSLAAFNELLIKQPSKHFTFSELRHIRQYLKTWTDLIRELHYVLEILHIAWFDTRKKMMDGDNILPIMCALMPKNKDLLTALIPRFYFAVDVDKENESTYYFTVLGSAAEQALADLAIEADQPLVPSETDEHLSFLKKLRNPVYYNLLFILVKLSALCQYRMQICEERIFQSLAQHKFLAYPDDDFVSVQQKHQRRSDNIKMMATQLQKEPFVSDTKLTLYIRRHLAYQDFEKTLSRTHILGILKLADLARKFDIYKEYTMDDFNSVEIELSEHIREFLEIPAIRKKSLFNLFVTPPTKVPLNTFIHHLSKKMETLAVDVDESPQATFTIPEPEQLAELLRQSF